MALNGRINKCGVIRYVPRAVQTTSCEACFLPLQCGGSFPRRKTARALGSPRKTDIVPPSSHHSPRYDLSHTDVEDWVGRLLPSRLFGVIVLTTANGILDHEEARRKKVGGKVLGFFY